MRVCEASLPGPLRLALLGLLEDDKGRTDVKTNLFNLHRRGNKFKGPWGKSSKACCSRKKMEVF